MNKVIVINMNFNTLNFNPARLTEDWIIHRIKIFMNYTCRSIINQTNQSFICF
ncbi:hypothetical protein [Romboutsia sp.]|uniref:hypothetical protein n=1 Tax=Romboutsia sp. TaxID=1965302 RepID=UPI003F32F4E4